MHLDQVLYYRTFIKVLFKNIMSLFLGLLFLIYLIFYYLKGFHSFLYCMNQGLGLMYHHFY